MPVVGFAVSVTLVVVHVKGALPVIVAVGAVAFCETVTVEVETQPFTKSVTTTE